jgi:hypothetical protein
VVVVLMLMAFVRMRLFRRAHGSRYGLFLRLCGGQCFAFRRVSARCNSVRSGAGLCRECRWEKHPRGVDACVVYLRPTLLRIRGQATRVKPATRVLVSPARLLGDGKPTIRELKAQN